MQWMLRGLIPFLLDLGLLLNPCGGAQQRAQSPHDSTVSNPAAVSSDQRDQEDDKILRTVSNASTQVEYWTDAWMNDLLNQTQDTTDVRKVVALYDRIHNDRRSESHWEESIWTIPNSELLPGEHIWQHVGTFVMVEGTGSTMRQRLPKCRTNPEECGSASDTATISYVVDAPLDIRARILVERLRQAISHYSAILQFRGKPTDDAFVTAWNTAWFDARNVYCRRSPGGKYRDLLGEEQVCK
jgi:hypothetical protein